ncbi:MAG TPA: DUF4262 domain-containing protein [Acidimicrobiia bacterium]|nr:DUF4262 domain-containing protein [Acidimicrobiia bacterium]
MDAATQAWLDQEDARVSDVIRRHGWYIQYVGGGLCSRPGCDGGDDEGPAFAYTVGLFGLGHPELIIFGVYPETALGVLNDLGERIMTGANLLPGQLITFDKWPHRVVPEEVSNPGDIVFTANRFYQRPNEASVPVLQLSYDDDAGRFPWEEGHSEPERQPSTGTFSAWS